MPWDTKLIGSHFVSRIKEGDQGLFNLEGRLMLRRNRDRDRHSARSNSASAYLSVIRLKITLVTILGIEIATLDVKVAYMQLGLIHGNLMHELQTS